MGFGVRAFGFKFSFVYLLVVGFRVNELIFSFFSFCFCEMGMMVIVVFLWDYGDGLMNFCFLRF